LKYESVEENADKVKILQRFGYNIKALCKNHDHIFGTTFTSAANHGTNNLGFIPPPPQRLLDMIIQQHYNHFLDYGEDDLGPQYDLPNLLFKKIELVPPTNTKPFGKVSFCSWRPKYASDLFFFDDDGSCEDDEEGEDSASKSPPPDIYLLSLVLTERSSHTFILNGLISKGMLFLKGKNSIILINRK
jgi:hypothetical protein